MAERQQNLGLVDGLVQLSTLVQNTFSRAAAAHGLSTLQARLLGVLRDRDPTMAELRRLLDLDKSSTTGLVDRAERLGLVRRVAVPEDGRSFRVEMTEQGRDLVQEFVADVSHQLQSLADHLSDENRHRLSLLASSLVIHNAADHGVDLSDGVVSHPAKGTPR